MSFIIRPLSSSPRSLLLPLGTRTFSATPARAYSKITLVGRLTGEPELVPTSTGQEVVKYVVANSYGTKVDRKTNFWRVSYFGRENSPTGRRDFMLSLGKG